MPHSQNELAPRPPIAGGLAHSIEDGLVLVAAVSIVIFLALCLFALVSFVRPGVSFNLAEIEKGYIVVRGMRQESLAICIQKADALNNEGHVFRWVCAVVPR